MIYPDINSAFINALEDVVIGDELLIRNKKVKELVNYSFAIGSPTKRFLTCPYRYNNPMATAAELLWVMSGRNDVEFLEYFLPNAPNFSDDGSVWGGAYGPRLRWFNSAYNRTFPAKQSMQTPDYDQIRGVLTTLTLDQYSRQAVIVIPQPDMDYDPKVQTADRPCTVFVQFLVREDKLHCFVRMRSNDVIWGCFNINVFEWTFLQEIIAGILGVKIGMYHHNAISFHIYEQMYARAKNILDSKKYNVYTHEGNVEREIISFSNLHNFYYFVNEFLYIIEMAIENIQSTEEIEKGFNEIFRALPDDAKSFITYLCLPLSYCCIMQENYRLALKYLCMPTSIISPDAMIAGMEYLVRYLKKNDIAMYNVMSTRIKEMFRFSDMTFDFILGNWE